MKESYQPRRIIEQAHTEGYPRAGKMLSLVRKVFRNEKQRFKESTKPEKMLPIYEIISKHLP